MTTLARRAAALFLAAHGLVHVMGFVAAWQLATLPEISYRTTALNGALEVGDAGARLLGVAWLVGAGGFVAAAWGVWRGAAWAVRGAVLGATISLVVCVFGLPDSSRGAAIDVVILVGAAVFVYARTTQGPSPAH